MGIERRPRLPVNPRRVGMAVRLRGSIAILSRMSYVARLLGAAAGCVMGLAAVAASVPSAGQTAAIEPILLRPDAAVEQPLAPDGTVRVAVSLQAGDYADVAVEQLGIDVIVAVTGPGGEPIEEIDDTSELDGPEHVRIVAATSGTHLLAVRSEPLPAVRAGRCRLAVTAIRPATDADRATVAARAALSARLAALEARYEGASVGRREPAEVIQLAVDLGALADDAAAAGRLRSTDRAIRARSFLLLVLDRAPEVIAAGERRLAWLKGARYGAARAGALTQVAEARARVGESSRAIAMYQEALTIPQPPRAEAITRDNLGVAMRRSGRLQEALDLHQRALEYFRTAGPRSSVGVVLGRLALVWKQLGDLTRGIALETEAIEVFVEAGDRLGEIRTLTNLASTRREAGEFDTARTTAERALRRAIEAKVPLYEGHASLVLAFLELRVGNASAAVDRASRAATLFREGDYKPGEATAQQALGEAQLALGQLPEAEATLRLAIAGAREVGNPDDEASALSVAAAVARASGRLADARAALEAALVCIERTRASLGGAQLRASLVSLNHGVYEDHVDVLAALHRERPGEGFDQLALEASELSRARSLLDVLATSSIDVRAGVDPALLDGERDLRQRIAEKDLARHRAIDADNAAAAAGLEREVAELTDALRAMESRIAASGPAFAALTRPRAVAVEELRRDVLDADTVLLKYAVGSDRTWLFALTPTSLDTFELAGRARLDPLVRTALEALTARQRDGAGGAVKDADVPAALARLSAEVLGPIVDRLRGPWQGRRLVVVASGALEYVPFAALPLPGAAGAPPSPLMGAHEVVAAPSAAVIAELRRETAGRPPAAKTLAIVADPVFEIDDPRVARARLTRRTPSRPAVAPAAPVPTPTVSTAALAAATPPQPSALLASRGATRESLGRLVFSRREATALAEMVPAADRLVVTDFAATRRWALEAPLDRYRIVHFATHGLIDARQPALSSLVLSLVDERGTPIDGYLRMSDIYNRRLPVDLVVLSACRTALGADMQGEGLVGLTRGFMYAGARRVVASLWQVDDQATAQLMTRFYRHMLKDGKAPAAALRAAQRELAADPRWSAPYFWSGFVIQGDWR